jgi:chromosome segregation protein
LPALTERINGSAAEIGALEASQHALTERGYELDREGQEAQNRANEAAVELERATARERGQRRARGRAGSADRRGRRGAGADADAVGRDRRRAAQQHAFLETAAGEAKAFRQKVEARQQEARTAAEEVFTRSGSWKPAAATPCTC